MTFLRAILVLLVFVMMDARAASATYSRSQNFATDPTNWRQSQKNLFYGYTRTMATGGKGAAGGLFIPSTVFNYYADIYLGGSLDRSTPISASGVLDLSQTSGQPAYTTSSYVGHFRQSLTSNFINFVGFAITGSTGNTVLATAVVEFSDGTAYAGSPVTLTIGQGLVNWSYEWSPTGGITGQGTLSAEFGGATSFLRIPASAAGSNFGLNAFGLFQPPYSAPDGNSFLQMFVGNPAYTALPGNPPRLRVHGPSKIVTHSDVIGLSGTAQVQRGYSITAVRYRLIRNGKFGATRWARGTTNWTAAIHVPMGSSKIQIIARTDSGLTNVAERRVVRLP